MSFVILSGNEGLAVLKIQEYLNLINKHSLNKALVEDGVYGDETTNAICKFQESTGLPVTGIIDSMTWDKIIYKFKDLVDDESTEQNSSSTISYGSVGLDVEKMQEYLNKLSTSTPNLLIDGHFGIKTEEKVIKFQMKNALRADGKIGPITWNKIISLIR